MKNWREDFDRLENIVYDSSKDTKLMKQLGKELNVNMRVD
jgi:hypothetical protein